jgi:HTH-type transcriptional regulator / antitoxin HigA
MTTLTTATKHGYRLGRSYVDLLRRYPLTPIKNEADYARASDVLESLFGRDDLNSDQNKYLDTLILLVEQYEQRHDAAEFDKDISPREALRFLMDANDMNVTDIGAIVGTQPYASMILSGKRRIGLDAAKKLAERFKVDVGLFI